MLRGITFDLWDTVIDDDSDEASRADAGLASKRDARRSLACAAAGAGSAAERAAVTTAFDAVESEFNHAWHTEFVTWTVRQRVDRLESILGREFEVAPRSALIEQLERMELEVPPDPVPGMLDAVRALAGRYRLAVVSDAIFSPGRCLREWLALQGILEFFDAFAFSDEVGAPKPDPRPFRAAFEPLGVSPEEVLHVGDLRRTDVAGAQALGMQTARIRAHHDDVSDGPEADWVVNSHGELAALLGFSPARGERAPQT